MNYRLTISLSPEAFEHLEKVAAPGTSFGSKSAFIDYLIKKERDANLAKDSAAAVESNAPLTPMEEMKKNLLEMGLIQEKLGKKLDVMRTAIKRGLKLKGISEKDVPQMFEWLWSAVAKNDGSLADDRGKRFIISSENIDDYKRFSVLKFRNRELERMMANIASEPRGETAQNITASAESRTMNIFANVSALVREGKLGEDFADIAPNDPRAKNIMENFGELIDLLEKTEGTPEHLQVQEKIKAMMDSRIPKKTPTQNGP